MPRVVAAGLTCAAVLWAVAVLVGPLSRPRPGAAAAGALVYGAGALVCHQRPERSFHLEGRQLPVCARCTALYLAGALGAVAGWLGTARDHRRPRLLLVAAALPMALTVMIEWSGLAAPSNVLRAIGALPLGAAAGWLFVRMLRAETPEQIGYDAVV